MPRELHPRHLSMDEIVAAAADESDEASSVCSIEIQNLMDGITERFVSPQQKERPKPTIAADSHRKPHSVPPSPSSSPPSLSPPPPVSRGTRRSSSNNNNNNNGREIPTNLSAMAYASRVSGTTTFLGDSDDDEDLLSNVDYEEASLAMQTITRRSIEQSSRTTLERSNNSSFEGSHSSLLEKSHNSLEVPESPTKNEDKNSNSNDSGGYNAALLQQRRAARAARMEKVRERIAREKQEAARVKEPVDKAEREDMSEQSRRERAYEWYCRIGVGVPKKEMKRRIRNMRNEQDEASNKTFVTESDLDLLPWNFNGTLLNTTRLHKLGIK